MSVLSDKILSFLVEGKFLRRTIDFLDERIARASRFVLARTTPIKKNKVFFHTQEDSYCCNPKYICEELRKRVKAGEDLDIVWRGAAEGGRGGVPHDCRVVPGGTFQFFKEIFSANVVVTNSVLWVKSGFMLKKEQTVFETWHGSLGIKRFGKKDYKGGYSWVRGAIATGKMTSYCITNSVTVSDALRATYWPNTPMLEYGHPRNDIMFDNYAEKRQKIRRRFLKKYGVSEDTHFIMYGPTFRDSKNFDCYSIDIPGVLAACTERFGGKWMLLLRYHPSLIAVYESKDQLDEENADVLNVTDYPDMQELITIADIAITDYSSWIYDFMLQRRPGFIFATDIAKYNNERGFCFKLETTPFPIAVNAAQLNENIRAFDEKTYLENLEAFLTSKGCIEDGHASERAADKILEIIHKN